MIPIKRKWQTEWVVTQNTAPSSIGDLEKLKHNTCYEYYNMNIIIYDGLSQWYDGTTRHDMWQENNPWQVNNALPGL